MADEVFKQQRRRVTADDLDDNGSGNPLDAIQRVQQAVANETGKEMPQAFQMPFSVGGAIPDEFKRVMQEKMLSGDKPPVPPQAEPQFEPFEAPPERPRASKSTGDKQVKPTSNNSDELGTLLSKLAEKHQWEVFEFPSRGKFYTDIPAKVSIRAMTGEEEQILATPRFVRDGSAIDKIFARCIKERIRTEDLLSVDRTHLLIFLRGISYTPEYDVEVKCPNCSQKFPHVIDLNDLDVTSCPDSFHADSLKGELPDSGFSYTYRLPTGEDEREISNYREKRVKQWGSQSEDDTLLYRTALLLEEVGGVTLKSELAFLLKKLPIKDVGHLRNEINTPPFGVNTDLPLLCPICSEGFEIDLPLETSFFFPRKRTERTPA